MFGTFFKNLLDPAPEPLNPDARLAIASLLVRVAQSDNDYSQLKDKILRFLLHAMILQMTKRPRFVLKRKPWKKKHQTQSVSHGP